LLQSFTIFVMHQLMCH